MGVGAGLYMYVVVVQKFTFAISSPDEFLYLNVLDPYEPLRFRPDRRPSVVADCRHSPLFSTSEEEHG